jgi:hypothetical protein
MLEGVPDAHRFGVFALAPHTCCGAQKKPGKRGALKFLLASLGTWNWHRPWQEVSRFFVQPAELKAGRLRLLRKSTQWSKNELSFIAKKKVSCNTPAVEERILR